ncbi:MAG: EAL domain-containing protein [Oscillospiraceae bacterium]|nr:EAL domain-containing protein [Oscillospiraceae bacterium]
MDSNNSEAQIHTSVSCCRFIRFCDFESSAKALLSDFSDPQYALVCMKIHNMPFINDIFGVMTGNTVLEYVIKVLEDNTDERSVLTRVSSDYLIVLLDARDTLKLRLWYDTVNESAQKCRCASEGGFSVDILASIYNMTVQDEKTPIMNLVSRLIASLIHSSQNKGCFFYDSSVHDKISREMEIIKSLDAAMANNEFQIYLQPQHYLQHNDMVLSAEALVRWIKPDGKVIYPNEFVPALERNGLISKLDCHVMELTCRYISEHMNEDWFKGIVISVNVSKVDLKLKDFIQYYTSVRRKYNIPDGHIEIEFTESAVFEDYTIFKQIMFELRNSGFYCSIDDFGTGSSSLNMLKSMPVDVLKMDRMFFVCENENDMDRNNSVIASVVAMARGLGIKIVAEGIESPKQIDFLRKIGCDVIQGYVYSKPLSTDEFCNYVKNYIPKYLPQINRQTPAFPEMLDPDDPSLIYSKYIQILQYVSAFVLELDIENDIYKIVSYGKTEISSPNTGKYSVLFETICEEWITDEYKLSAEKNISLKGIIAAFYRGDKEIKYECRLKKMHYDGDAGAYWYLVHVCFEKDTAGEHPKAVMYISNIQDTKEKEMSVRSAEYKLKAAIKSIRGEIYDIDIAAQTALLLHSQTLDSENIMREPSDLNTYLKQKVLSEDAQKLKETILPDLSKDDQDEDDRDFYTEYRIKSDSGKILYKSIHMMINPGDKTHGTAIIQDITNHKMLEEKAANAEQTLYRFISTLCSGVFEVDVDRDYFRIIKDNNKYYRLFGEDCSYNVQFRKILGAADLFEDDRIKIAEAFAPKNFKQLQQSGNLPEIDFKQKTVNGYRWHQIRVLKSNDSAMIFIYDIDDKKVAQLQASKKYHYDKLTGVFMAKDFYDAVDEYTKRQGQDGEHILLIADIDNFQNVNSQHGRLYGDMLLCDFVQCMKKTIRRDDIIGRAGSDVFMIFLKCIKKRDISMLVTKIRNMFANENQAGKHHRDFCIGVSFYNSNHRDIRQMYTEAYSALKQAKKMGSGSYCAYDSSIEIYSADEDDKLIDTGISSDFSVGGVGSLYALLDESKNIRETIPAVLNFIGNRYDVSRVYIYETDEELYLKRTFQWCSEKKYEKYLELGQNDMQELKEQFSEVILNGRCISDISGFSEKFQDILKQMNVLSCLVYPIISDEKCYGIIGFDECVKMRVWTQEEKNTLSQISGILGTFIAKSENSDNI